MGLELADPYPGFKKLSGWIAEELKGDREIVMAAVASNGYALQYASEDLKSDHEIVKKAVSQNGIVKCQLSGLNRVKDFRHVLR